MYSFARGNGKQKFPTLERLVGGLGTVAYLQGRAQKREFPDNAIPYSLAIRTSSTK